MRISDWSSDVCSSDLVRRQSADDPRDRAAARRGGWRERERGRGRRDAGDARGAAEGRTVAMTAETPVTVEDDDGRSEEHTSELQSLMRISYAVFCLQKKKNIQHRNGTRPCTTQTTLNSKTTQTLRSQSHDNY